MSSTLVVLSNKILRNMGQGTVVAGNFSDPDDDLQQVIDAINDTVKVDSRATDWSFLHTSGSQSSNVGDRQLIMSSISNLDFMRPLRRLFETTTPATLRPAGDLEWNRLTATVNDGTPVRFRYAGTTQNATSLVWYMRLELDPRPSTSISYTAEGYLSLPELSGATDRAPFTDEILVNGALMRMLDYLGNDNKLATGLHEQSLERMKMQNDDSDIVWGSENDIEANETAPPILPSNYGDF